MHPARLLAVTALATSLAACAGGAQPGWTYAPPPSPTPTPSASPSATASPSAAASPSASASAAPSAVTDETVVKIAAAGIKFSTASLGAPADEPFRIEFDNQDAGIPHNVAIRDAGGADVFTGELFPGPEVRTYDVPPIPAGTYTFLCTAHPNMTGDLTVQ